MKIHSKTRNPIFLNSTALEEVEAFTNLGSVVDTTGGTDADIRSRINKARGCLTCSERSGAQKTSPPTRYASSTPTWCCMDPKHQNTQHRLQTLINTCLRRISNIWWKDKVNNVTCGKEQDPIDLQIRVELDWPHPQKTCQTCLPTSPEMEPPREKEKRSLQVQLELYLERPFFAATKYIVSTTFLHLPLLRSPFQHHVSGQY